MLDPRLEDRSLPFLDKLSIASSLLNRSVVLNQNVLEWTLSTLLKLSKTPNPREDVFCSKLLWAYLHNLFFSCFPKDKPLKFTDFSSRCAQVVFHQPVLPSFVMYMKMTKSQVLPEFHQIFLFVCDLFLQNRIDLGGQLSNYIELCSMGQKFDFYPSCLQVLLCAFRQSNPKKTLSILLDALPFLLSDVVMIKNELLCKEYLQILLDEVSIDNGTVPDSIFDCICKFPTCLQVLFFEMFLLKFKSDNLNKYRTVGFSLFQRVIKHNPHTLSSLITLLDRMNVYVHKNDQIYSEQCLFLKQFVSSASVDVLSAILSLDYYLITSCFELLHKDILHAPEFQRNLFAMAVKSREVDNVVRLMRARDALPDKHVFFMSLHKLDVHMIRHYYESQGAEISDGYHEVLLYLCQYEDLAARLDSISTLTSESRNRLLRFSHKLEPDIIPVEHKLEFVPEMNSMQFKQFLSHASEQDIQEMLSQPVFYELKKIQKSFEKWLVGCEVQMQSKCLPLIPVEYLSSKACKKVIHVPGIGRILRRRPRLLQLAIETEVFADGDVMHACCRYAVQTKIEYLPAMIRVNLPAIVSIRPINPDASAIILKSFTPIHQFIPHLTAFVDNRESYLEQIRDKDPSAMGLYPHLFQIPLEKIEDQTVLGSVFGEYKESEQSEYLRQHQLTPFLFSKLLNEKRSCPATVNSILNNEQNIQGTPTIKLLIGMVSIDSDRIIPIIFSYLSKQPQDPSSIGCLSLLVRHRPAVFASRYLPAFVRLAVSALAGVRSAVSAHDYHRLLMDIVINCANGGKSDRAREALLVLLIKYSQLYLESELQCVLDSGFKSVARVVDGERALLWAATDDVRGRIRDLLT